MQHVLISLFIVYNIAVMLTQSVPLFLFGLTRLVQGISRDVVLWHLIADLYSILLLCLL